MIKAVVFDLWNTLLTRSATSPRRVLEILHIDLNRENMVLFEHAVMTREFDKYEDFIKALEKAFSLTIDEKDANAIREVTNSTKIQYFPDVKPVLEELKKDYTVCLLSNTYAYVLNHLDTSMFDEVFVSSEIGAIKPDVAAFNHVEHAIKLKPEEIVMVGDSIPSDMEGALNAGWKAIHLDRRNRKMFKPRITTLSELAKMLGDDYD